tara:strand:- start:7943 stop:9139 length:1197 start_codon:yes stop_codon:yes gene_type:complete
MILFNIKKSNNLYLDACASTPIHEKVLEEIIFVNQNFFANPSSIHSQATESAELLERSRMLIANKLNANINDIIFTSGATESINFAIKGAASSIKPGRIVISSVEHPSVQNAALSLKALGWDVIFWPVDKYGTVNLNYIDKYLEEPTKILSIIWGQSDIGTIQPIQHIGNECKKRGIVFHSDATQVLPHGLFNWRQLPVDLLSASAHKFQGPKGIGLLLKKNTKLRPLLLGGKQENGMRAGTEPLPLIVGMARAISLIENELILNDTSTEFPGNKVSEITNYLATGLSKLDNIHLVGNKVNFNRLPNHISILVGNKNNKPISGRSVVRKLSEKGISCSTGSACKSGVTEDSEILVAINVTKEWRKSLIRLSLGPWLDYSNIVDIPSILKIITQVEEYE